MPGQINCNCRLPRSTFDENCPVHEADPKDAEIRDLKRKFAILEDDRDHLDIYLHEIVSQVLHRDFRIWTDLSPGSGNGSRAMREIERLQGLENLDN